MRLTLEEARERSEIDKNAMDDENVRQGQLIFDATQELAKANANRDASKKALERLRAELDQDIRDSFPKDEKKPTEAQISMSIARDPRMQKAEDSYGREVENADRWLGAVEALRAKGWSLRGLGDLYAANYFTAESTGSKRREVETRRADGIRAEAGAARERRPSLREGRERRQRE